MEKKWNVIHGFTELTTVSAYMRGEILPAPRGAGTTTEAGDGAGLEVFNTLPIFVHACRLQCGRWSAHATACLRT